MYTNCFQTVKIALATAALLAGTWGTASAQPAQGNTGDDLAIVGTWVVTVSPDGMPSFRAYNVFSADGNSLEFDNSNPPSQQTVAVGPWKKIGPRQFAFTEINDLFDAQGNFQSELKVKSTLTVNQASDQFHGSFQFTVYDPKGAIVFQGYGTALGQRVAID